MRYDWLLNPLIFRVRSSYTGYHPKNLTCLHVVKKVLATPFNCGQNRYDIQMKIQMLLRGFAFEEKKT